jgi:uncharacterized protein involved in response to NO
VLLAGLVSAFAAEALGLPTIGAMLRATAATLAVLLIWRIFALPRRDVPGYVLWGSGWMVLAGLWLAALAPRIEVAALHVTFVGGFAMLTLGIATRVIVAHGRQPLALEARILDVPLLALLFAALAARIAADLAPAQRILLLGASGTLWVLAWALWSARTLRFVSRAAPAVNQTP